MEVNFYRKRDKTGVNNKYIVKNYAIKQIIFLK